MEPAPDHRPRPTANANKPVLWVIAGLLAIIATCLVLRLDDRQAASSAAWAQTPAAGAGRLGARGIYAFTGQLTRNSYGVFMLDVDTGTLWCYELVGGVDGAKQLRLVAARSWVYDRYLREFNAADPTPSAVEQLVAQQMAGAQAPNPTAETEGTSKQPATGLDDDQK